ncbi:MAG: class II D-tagatose-bisphosphate aldolase non-catalytic subunit [Anaerolineales bacterium]
MKDKDDQSIAERFPLDNVVRAQKRGEAQGITSVCSANPFVVEACLLYAKDSGTPVLIESTCNQVNQYGGYTGQTPADFKQYLERIADQLEFPFERIFIGGDHLGPSVWQNEPADEAMAKSRVLVRDCVLAGYTKIHLDASMRCADDPQDTPLDKRVSARRAAELAYAAEDAFRQVESRQIAPRYIIGTEVPLPGGILGKEEHLSVTPSTDVEETIEITKEEFFKAGLEDAWQRVVAVVTQPGVEYGDQTIFDYDPERATDLSRFIEDYDSLVYEAHSTDYQARNALRRLVRDHFAVLKVGPALTFAFREAIFALSLIEEELLSGKPGKSPSNVQGILEHAMLDNPVYWEKYHTGSADERGFARKYSLSDRSRYYWPVPSVQQALKRLLANLGQSSIPLTLLSQYLPIHYSRVREGSLANRPRALIMDKIKSVLSDYAFACAKID